VGHGLQFVSHLRLEGVPPPPGVTPANFNLKNDLPKSTLVNISIHGGYG
jgi:hypothetical protein